VTAKHKLASADLTHANLALVTGLDDLPALRLTARVKLFSPALTANASLVFAARSAGDYRYVKIKPGGIVVGNKGGSVVRHKTWPFTIGKWYTLRVDAWADGRVKVFVGDPAVRILSTTFGSGASGGVGLAVSKGKSLFDDVYVYDGSVLGP
jgi:hypothetical protein